MRKHYDFSKAVRGNAYAARLAHLRAGGEPEDDLPLTRSQIKELERRVRDLEDRTRYFLASVMTPRFILYYNVSEDDFALNEPDHATLFKRRAAAAAVRALIGDRIKIVRCRVDKRGRLVLSSLPSPFPRRRRRKRRGQGRPSRSP